MTFQIFVTIHNVKICYNFQQNLLRFQTKFVSSPYSKPRILSNIPDHDDQLPNPTHGPLHVHSSLSTHILAGHPWNRHHNRFTSILTQAIRNSVEKRFSIQTNGRFEWMDFLFTYISVFQWSYDYVF